MRKKTLYFFLDIDLTLYSPALGKVPDSAVKAIEQARANGSKVFLCTGRSLAEASDYLEFPVDGFVMASGATCIAEGKCIFDHPIDPGDAEQIAELIRSLGMGLLVGGGSAAYLDEKCRAHVITYVTGGETDPAKRDAIMRASGFLPYHERRMDDPVYKLGAGVSHGTSFEPLKTQLPEPYRMNITLSSAEGDFADISDGSITKSSGIQRILDVYGASMKDAIGIGDSTNDLDMIRSCGLGIAMGNANEEVRRAADWVTAHIDEDGIWHAFEYAGVL